MINYTFGTKHIYNESKSIFDTYLKSGEVKTIQEQKEIPYDEFRRKRAFNYIYRNMHKHNRLGHLKNSKERQLLHETLSKIKNKKQKLNNNEILLCEYAMNIIDRDELNKLFDIGMI